MKEEDIILLFRYYLPLENGMTLYLDKLESPLPKDALCQVWLKLAQWFWRRFFNIFNIILLFHYYLPLEKGVALYLNKLESPPPKDALCQIRLKLAQWLWRRRWKCEVYDNDDDRQWTNFDQKSSLESSAQVS